MKRNQVTLSDIADRLKVSKVTVSKALRDHTDIGQATKQLVKDTARELGYTPNFIARNLSARKTTTIGLLVPKIAHHFFATAIEAIYDTAFANNYEIIMAVSQENSSHEAKHIETMLSMRVDGLLVSVTEETEDMAAFKLVRDKGVPLVFFDRVVNGLGFSCVTADDKQGACLAVAHAIERGYTDIGHFAGFSHTQIGYRRCQGYRLAMQQAGLPVNPDWVLDGGFGEKDGFRSFMQLHDAGNLPQVIFAVSYPVALGVYAGARETGLAIPRDIDVISFGGSSENRFFKPALTYVDQPADVIARHAMEMLLHELQHPGPREEEHIVIPSTLCLGDTCAGPRVSKVLKP